MRITVAEAYVNTLEAEGVRHVFGLAGSQFLDVVDVIHRRGTIRYVPVRHEQGASFAAYGYARASRGTGVCMATVGPGSTNLLTGVTLAYRGRVPLVAFTAKQARSEHETNDVQEMDQVSIYRPVTKWSYMPPIPERAPAALRRAFRLALTHPYGPVHINTPKDLLSAEVEWEPVEPSRYRAAHPIAAEPELVDAAAALLRQAERPVVLAGGHVLWEGAVPDLVALAEALGLPVVTDIYHPDAFPQSHPLGIGPMGKGGWASANRLVGEADVVLAVGVHLDHITTLYNYTLIPKTARLVHVSPVAEEIGDVFPVDVGVVSSVRPFLRALAERTRGWKRWDTRRAAALKQEYEAAMAAADHPGAKRIRTPFVVRRVRDVLDRSAVVVLDAGNYATYVRNLYPAWEPETYIDSDNMACLGSGFLMALGVKVARPDRPVVALVGDGGFIMGLHELETAVRERINVVAVVFNDFGFGNIRGYQREFYGERYVGCNFGNPDFALVARAFGAHGERVEDPAVLADALRRALDADRPAVVEVLTDPDELAPGLYSRPRS